MGVLWELIRIATFIGAAAEPLWRTRGKWRIWEDSRGHPTISLVAAQGKSNCATNPGVASLRAAQPFGSGLFQSISRLSTET